MRNFIRYAPVKALTFLLIIILMFSSAVGMFGAVLMIKAGFYENPESKIIEDYELNMLRRYDQELIGLYAIPLLNTGETKSASPYKGVHFTITDAEGDLLLGTDGDRPVNDYSYSFDFYIHENAVYGFSYHEPDGYDGEKYTFRAYYSAEDSGSELSKLTVNLIHFGYDMLYGIWFITAGCLLLAIPLFVVLMCAAGRRANSEDIYPGPLNRVPFDIMLTIFTFTAFFVLYSIIRAFEATDYPLPLILAVYGIIYSALFLGMCMSAAVRIKQRRLIKGTLIFIILRAVWKLIRLIGKGIKNLIIHLPSIWLAVVIFIAVSFADFIVLLLTMFRPPFILLWFIGQALLFPLVVYLGITLTRFEKAGKRMASGDLNYRMPKGGMLWKFRKHADDMNRISEGMERAVDEKIKSERMKTELITNVSHDIKTPLTSIINYTALIGAEDCDNPKIKEYSEVLLRQSERLKRLINDLVEASKASTGNLEVELAPCDASVFITQAAGEYEEKLQSAGLSLIARRPDEAIVILADGRRMQRVFDNLLDNIRKYSLTGSRVYITLDRAGKNAVISFKNTSKDIIEIDPSELTERFVRGDSSRNAEGSGLGLSIAKSLTELQGGVMDISCDGDQFRVYLTFPTVN